MRNLTSSMFKEVYRVEDGVLLLDIFRPVFTRTVCLQTYTHIHTLKALLNMCFSIKYILSASV